MGRKSIQFINVLLQLFMAMFLCGCVGTVIETATDAAIAVAKVPFKVGAAVVDVVTDDDDDEDEDEDDDDDEDD